MLAKLDLILKVLLTPIICNYVLAQFAIKITTVRQALICSYSICH